MTVFAYGLCERFFLIERDRSMAQETALTEAKGYANLQSQYNERLEEDVISRTVELKESNEQKDEILRILAHDLKSPIDGVGKLSRLLSETQLADPELVKASAREIELSATYLSELTKNLLDWSNLRSKEAHIEMQPYLIDDLRQSTEQVFQMLSRQKRLKFAWKSSADYFGYFDFNAIETVLRNLMSNAVKYSPENSLITVESALSQDRILFTVSDQGCGIAPDQLDKLQGQSQVDSMMGLNGEPGMGIGLQICHRILEYHQTRLEIKSELAEGTICRFSLQSWSNLDDCPPSKA
jgi:signal transduction histidine kinase